MKLLQIHIIILLSITSLNANAWWNIDALENEAYTTFPDGDKIIATTYDTFKAVNTKGNEECILEDQTSTHITCHAVNSNIRYKVKVDNLSKQLQKIINVKDGHSHWLLWETKDAFTVEYSLDPSLTFDTTTLDFKVNGFPCTAIINGTYWVTRNQLSYNEWSVPHYSWDSINNKAALSCGRIKASLSGLRKKIIHLKS